MAEEQGQEQNIDNTPDKTGEIQADEQNIETASNPKNENFVMKAAKSLIDSPVAEKVALATAKIQETAANTAEKWNNLPKKQKVIFGGIAAGVVVIGAIGTVILKRKQKLRNIEVKKTS